MFTLGMSWLILLLQTGAALEYPELSTHSAQMGSNTTIPCKFDVASISPVQQSFTILWHFQEREIFRSPLKSPDPRLSVDQAGIHDGIADLSMSRVSIADGGLYICSMVHTSGRKVKEIRLDIYAPPQITITSKTIFINKESVLSCLISGFHPVDIDIKWLRNGNLLDNVTVDRPQRNPDGTYNIRSSVTITPTEEDRERIFSYKIQHESLYSPLQEDIQLIFGGNESTEDTEGSTQSFLLLSILVPVVVVVVIGVIIITILLCKKKGRKKVAENEADQNERLVSNIPSARKEKADNEAVQERPVSNKTSGAVQQEGDSISNKSGSLSSRQQSEPRMQQDNALLNLLGASAPCTSSQNPEPSSAQGREPLNSEHSSKNKRSTSAGSSGALQTNAGQQWAKREVPAQQTRHGPGPVELPICRQQEEEQQAGTFLEVLRSEGNPAELKTGDIPQTRDWSRNKKFTSYRPCEPPQEQNKSHMTGMKPTTNYSASMASRYNPTQGREPLNSEHSSKNKRSTSAGSSGALQTNAGQQWAKREVPAQQTRHGPGPVELPICRQQEEEQQAGTFLEVLRSEGNPAELKTGDIPQTRDWSRNKKFTSYRPCEPPQEQNKSHMTGMKPTTNYSASMASRYNPTQGREPLNSEHSSKNKRSTSAGSSGALQTNAGQQWAKREVPAQQTRHGPGPVELPICRQQEAGQQVGTFLEVLRSEGNPAELKTGDIPQTRDWSRNKKFTSYRPCEPPQEQNKSHMTGMKPTTNYSASMASRYNPRDIPQTRDWSRNKKFTSYRPCEPPQEQNKSHMTGMKPTTNYSASMASRYNPRNQSLVKKDFAQNQEHQYQEKTGRIPERRNTKLTARNMEASKMEVSNVEAQHPGKVKTLKEMFEGKEMYN